MKVFISQPMKGKTSAEIEREREKAILSAVREYGSDVEILDSHFKDFDGSAVQFLGKAIELLGTADVALFLPGWQEARGCRIEHTICEEYGIKIALD